MLSRRAATWARVELAAGKSDIVEFSLPDDLHELCIGKGCELIVPLEASRPGDASDFLS